MAAFVLIRLLRRGPFTPGLAAALATGVALHVAGMALIGFTWRLPAPPPEPGIFVRAERGDSVMNEQAALLDQSPYFLPTALNYASEITHPDLSAGDAPPLPEPARPRDELPGAQLLRTPRHASLRTPASATPEQRLPTSAGDTFLAFGRSPADTGALKPSAPRAVLRDEATGKILAEAPLTAPPAKELPAPATLLRPAVFFVASDDYGVTAPVLRESCGDDAHDTRLAKSLVELMAQNPPPAGRLIVTVSP